MRTKHPNHGPFNSRKRALLAAALLGTLAAAVRLAPAQTWTESYTNGNWLSVACYADGSGMVAGASTGAGNWSPIFDSTDQGADWLPLDDGGLPWGPSYNCRSIVSSAYGGIAAVISGAIYTDIPGYGFTPTTAPFQDWSCIASSADGTKIVVVASDNYSGGPGQIYTSSDWGTNWAPAAFAPSLAWSSVASSADGTKLVAAAMYVNSYANPALPGVIYTSSDSGARWALTTAPSNHWSCVASSADGTRLVAGTQDGQIYLSSDSGANWALTTAPNQTWSGVASSADGGKLVAVARGGGIFSSTDSGATWLTNDAPSAYWTGVACSADGNIRVAVQNGGIYTATPGPLDHFAITGVPATAIAGAPLMGVTIAAQDAYNYTQTGFTGTVTFAGTAGAKGGSAAFTNGVLSGVTVTPTVAGSQLTVTVTGAGASGTTTITTLLPAVSWAATTAPGTNWTAIAASSDYSKLVAAVAGGPIFTSRNGGISWSAGASPIQDWQAVACSSDGSRLVAAAYNGPIYTSLAFGPTWTPTWTPTLAPREKWTSIACSANGTIVAAVAFGGAIYRSQDAGWSWSPTDAPRAGWTSVAVSADGIHMAAVAYGGGIYTSSDVGVNWSPTTAPGAAWTSICSSADGTKLAAAVYGGQIWTSSDSGQNWAASGPSQDWSCVACSADGSKLVAGVDGGLVYTSNDSGNTWLANNTPDSNWASVAMSSDGSRIAAVDYDGSSGFIYTTPALPPVRLNITRSGHNVVISWSALLAGFTLQQNTNLAKPNWTAVGTVPTVANGRNQVIVTSPPGSKAFYRLMD